MDASSEEKEKQAKTKGNTEQLRNSKVGRREEKKSIISSSKLNLCKQGRKASHSAVIHIIG
jgi:hypothetical protein